jgi:hypothetical protein
MTAQRPKGLQRVKSLFSASAGWAVWAVLPVGVIAYHYGPGQAAYVQDRAAALHAEARSLERTALELQDAAYTAHLAAIEARKTALVAPTDGAAGADAAVVEATKREDAAYAAAASAWSKAADAYGATLEVLGDAAPEEAARVRWSQARAQVRAGDVWTGITSLEALLEEESAAGRGDDAQARAVREELATAYYYGARLLRLSGMPAQEWRIESGKARQHFRYLAESSREGDAERARAQQRNLELVLNLEQSSLAELQGRPLPRESPCKGNMACRTPGKGNTSQRPPERRDARGAGGAGPIGDGW